MAKLFNLFLLIAFVFRESLMHLRLHFAQVQIKALKNTLVQDSHFVFENTTSADESAFLVLVYKSIKGKEL